MEATTESKGSEEVAAQGDTEKESWRKFLEEGKSVWDAVMIARNPFSLKPRGPDLTIEDREVARATGKIQGIRTAQPKNGGTGQCQIMRTPRVRRDHRII